MRGKLAVLAILGAAAAAGAGLYYLEQFHWYDVTEMGDATLPLATLDGGTTDLAVTGLSVAEGASSPLKYRACFRAEEGAAALAERAARHPDPVPTTAPRNFPCFSADAIASALVREEARAFRSGAETPYGIDRVVAIGADGTGFAWHQINRCGAAVFDGDPPPPGCPPPPDRFTE
jgi:hypothetical protein